MKLWQKIALGALVVLVAVALVVGLLKIARGSPSSKCNSSKCKNGGTCNSQDGTCTCPATFGGPDCSMATCSGSGPSDSCSGGSACVSGLCSGKLCTGCSADNGTCDYTVGKCICKNKYSGDDCTTPPPECSVDGDCQKLHNAISFCKNGACGCPPGYVEPACSSCTDGYIMKNGTCAKNLCYEISCGNGNCDSNTGKCVCSGMYFGKDCLSVCSSEGGSIVQGDCVCKAGYGGVGCGVKCPVSAYHFDGVAIGEPTVCNSSILGKSQNFCQPDGTCHCAGGSGTIGTVWNESCDLGPVTNLALDFIKDVSGKSCPNIQSESGLPRYITSFLKAFVKNQFQDGAAIGKYYCTCPDDKLDGPWPGPGNI